MRLAITLSIFVLASSAIAADATGDQVQGTQVVRTIPPMEHASELAALLDSAFRLGSSTLRHEFFEQWHRESVELQSTHATQAPSASDIHEIFREIYKPDTSTLAIATGAWLSDSANRARNGSIDSAYLDTLHRNIGYLKRAVFPRDVEYVVVNAQVTYRRQADNDATNVCPDSPETDSRAQWEIEDSLAFYPRVEFYGKPVLYLTTKYEQALDEFLAISNTDTTRSALTAVYEAMHARRAFLQPEIPIAQPFGPGWLYLTFPALWDVTFSADLTRAWISFSSTSWSHRWACCSKSGGRWIVELSDIERVN